MGLRSFCEFLSTGNPPRFLGSGYCFASLGTLTKCSWRGDSDDSLARQMRQRIKRQTDAMKLGFEFGFFFAKLTLELFSIHGRNPTADACPAQLDSKSEL